MVQAACYLASHFQSTHKMPPNYLPVIDSAFIDFGLMRMGIQYLYDLDGLVGTFAALTTKYEPLAKRYDY